MPKSRWTKGTGGCIFCSQKGSGEHLKKLSIKEQVEFGLEYKKVHKISWDAPKDLLVASEWNSHKKWIINGIEKYLEELD